MITKPKGCYDIFGTEGMKWQYVSKLIDSLMEKYHYQWIRTPIFEVSELFHRGVGEDTDVVSKETYDFKDRGNRMMTLRPEGTAGVVRSFIENKMYGDPSQPVKLYYNETMYRYERPQAGRDREFTQFGVEVLGSEDPIVDAEVISIPVNLFKILGLQEIKVKINTLGDQSSRDQYRQALLDHFKPFLPSLCPDCQARYEKNPMRILDCKVDRDHEALKTVPKTLDFLNEESKKRFLLVQEYLRELEIEYEVDPTIVRGLDYYNHTVFEIEAHVEGFGSNNVLAGGGRYNGLVEKLEGPSTPGIGFGLGLGRLITALDLEHIALPILEDIEVFVMYVSPTEKKYALSLVQMLRMNGFRVEMEYMNRGLKGQFKQADRFKSRYLIILNDEDLKFDRIKIKNNQTKEEECIEFDYLIYYLEEHLSDEVGELDSCHCDCKNEESEHDCCGSCHKKED